MLDAEPGTDSSALANPVLFKVWPEPGVVIEVMNVLGKPVATDGAGDTLNENVRVVIVPDSVTIVSLQVVSIDNEGVNKDVNGGIGESVTMVVVPDSIRVVSLHVVSIEDGGSEENVTTVVVPDWVEPIEAVLVIPGSEEACVTVKDADATVDPAGNCEEIPADVEELDGGNGPDVDRAEGAPLDASPERTDDGPLVPGIPVEDVTTEPVKDIIDVAELGLGPTIELVPAPTDEVLPWPLKVSAPVFAEVIIDSEDEASPVVRVAMILLIELVATIDEMLLEIPDDNGIGLASEPVGTGNVGGGTVRLPLMLVVISADEVLFDKLDENIPVLVIDSICETEPELTVVISLGILVDGKDVALVKFERGYGPEVEVWLGMTEMLVLRPELVPKMDSLEVED
ncbi:hypothetical protein E0Z10_g7184 [Xylaria hypoxylon]|uniref:Uncharacterized protein n=1 Tax=Xylaria hypoxylon TaxID=37992 RepID=A0A4Z0YYZ0_9PEZI|nr:hypothetical protein E0Z10_g7184 [Xylaria hypoxylon]